MLKKIKKIIKSVIVAVSSLTALTPFSAHAGLVSFGADAITFILFFGFYVIQYISGFMFSLAGYFAGKALELNYGILSSSNALVYTGWTITRDLANLGFVFVIIIIAIATIVRWNTYGNQKLLMNLIAAAILVNFSLTIAAVVIDFSHVLTRFFFKPIINESLVGSLGDAATAKTIRTISGAFNPQKLFAEPEEPEPVDPDEEVGAFAGFATGQIIKIAGIFFTIIFTLLATLVIFALGVLLFLRYLHLTFLMVISPIVWLFWAVPKQGGHFGKWWTDFFKWCFFAPSSAFFVYLALVSIQKINDGFATVETGAFFKNGALAAIAQQGVNMVVLCGFLIYGLQLSQSTGSKVASSFVNFANKQGQKIKATTKDWANRRWTQAATAVTGSAAGQKVTEVLTREGKNKFTQFAKSWYGAPKLGVAVEKFTAKRGKLVESSGKRYADLNDDQLARIIHTMDAPSRVYALERLTKNNSLDKVNVFDHLTEPNKKLFGTYNRVKQFSDMEKAVVTNVDLAKDEKGWAANYAVRHRELKSKVEKDDELQRGARRATSADDLERIRREREANISPTEKAAIFDEFNKLQGIRNGIDKNRESYRRTFSDADLDKIKYGDLLAHYDDKKRKFGLDQETLSAIQTSFIKATAEINPGDMAKVLKATSAKTLDNIISIAKGVGGLNNELKRATKHELSSDEKANKFSEKLEKLMATRAAGGFHLGQQPDVGVAATSPAGGGGTPADGAAPAGGGTTP